VSKDGAMSEYQYYEFQAIDRALTEEEQAHVRTLSRRVEPTPRQAIFTYSYGDFRGDPLTLLETHFDAMLYMANWGTRELAFRFPRELLNLEPLQRYYWAADEITLKTTDQHVVLDIHFDDEDGGDWIEGEGLLSTLALLREDILRGDLRALHLAYLKSARRAEEMGDDDFDDGLDDQDADATDDDAPVDLPMPPELNELSAPLRAFVDFFEIDADLIRKAAADSPPLERHDEGVERRIALLPDAERDAWLVRLARSEPHLDVQFLRRLRDVGDH
jgi:hypothetical protein